MRKHRDAHDESWYMVVVLQNMLDVPQCEIEFWLRGNTRSLPWYDEKLEKCNSNWGTSSKFCNTTSSHVLQDVCTSDAHHLKRDICGE